MGTTNQKSTIDMHIKKKKQSKHNTKERHQITKRQERRGRRPTKKNLKQKQKYTY